MKKKDMDLYMDFAKRVAKQSHAKRLKVGAVIVKEDMLVYGYNGTPTGFDNNCENEISTVEECFLDVGGSPVLIGTSKQVTKPEVIHAEVNAIGKASNLGFRCRDATMFLTHSPCIECAKVIWRSGIKRVYFAEEYRSDEGTVLLRNTGIEVERYND